jgi:hypothetical protein
MINLSATSQDATRVAGMRRTVSSVASVNSVVEDQREEPLETRGQPQRQASLSHHALPTDTLNAQYDYSGESLVVRLSVRALELLKEANTKSATSNDPNTSSQFPDAVVDRRLPMSSTDGDRIKPAQRSTTNYDSGRTISTSPEISGFGRTAIEQATQNNGTSDRSSGSGQKSVTANPGSTDTSAYSIPSFSLQEADCSIEVALRKYGDTDSQSDDELRWVSRLRVSLPSLGMIDFNIAIRSDTVAIGMTSSRDSTEYLSLAVTELSAALADTGFRNPRIGVQSRD